MSHKFVMLGSSPRAKRSQSAIQIPISHECSSSAPFFDYSTSDFIYDIRNVLSTRIDGSRSNFEDLLMTRWEEARKQGVMNYDLNCMYKLLDGNFNLSVQLNVERGEMRRKPVRFRTIREPFNHLRWNFTKLKQSEVLLYLRRKDGHSSSDPLNRHIVAINAAPIERGHSLLLPSINRCMPQILSEEAIRLATDIMLLTKNETFHVLFNSLLGLASINHLHLHLLSWPYESDLINRRCEHLFDNMYAIKPPVWFTHAIVFQLSSAEHYEKFVMNMTLCVNYLSAQEIAHNVFFSRAQPLRTCGDIHSEDTKSSLPQLVTAYIFPRISIVGAKPASNFNPAALELSGCLTAYSMLYLRASDTQMTHNGSRRLITAYRFFEMVTEEIALRIMDEEVTLPDTQFNQICSELIGVLSGKKSDSEQNVFKNDDALSSPELDELRDSFQTFEMHSPRRFFPEEHRRFTFEGKLPDLKPGSSS